MNNTSSSTTAIVESAEVVVPPTPTTNPMLQMEKQLVEGRNNCSRGSTSCSGRSTTSTSVHDEQWKIGVVEVGGSTTPRTKIWRIGEFWPILEVEFEDEADSKMDHELDQTSNSNSSILRWHKSAQLSNWVPGGVNHRLCEFRILELKHGWPSSEVWSCWVYVDPKPQNSKTPIDHLRFLQSSTMDSRKHSLSS